MPGMFASLNSLVPKLPEEADVLYLQFQRPANIHISEIRDDGIIVEYDDADNVVGLTILEASTRSMI